MAIIPIQGKFCELQGKYEAMCERTINEDAKSTSIDFSLVLWKWLVEWGARLLDWCEDAMSMQKYGMAFKESYKVDAFMIQKQLKK